MPIEANEQADADASLRLFEVKAFENNAIKWSLTGQQGAVYYRTDSTMIADAHALSYENGRSNIDMTANKLFIDNLNENMNALGDVRITAENGRKILAESINYNGKTELFSSKEAVTIIYPEGDVINGIGFEADSKLNKIEIFNVTGITVNE